MRYTLIIICLSMLTAGCGSKKTSSYSSTPSVVNPVNPNYFNSANANNTITKVPCTLSDGSQSECYQIVSNSTPTDHQMGPWCPTNISDNAGAGGIWLSDGKVYDVDGAFVKNLASFYDDTTWKMYDDNGNIFVTNTQEDCENAANPNVGEEYKNFCVECLPSYIGHVSQSYLIPVKPVFIAEPVAFMGRGGGGPNGAAGRPDGPPPGGRPDGAGRPERGDRSESGARPERGGSGVPATRGIALNGVEFSAPAPVNNILGAYTLAPFDDAGGHINVHQGYHYHAATGVSYAVKQSDGHASLIGYAIDGHGIYENLDANGNAATGLDDCRGQYDDVRGYHYHVDAAGNNNFINCIHGAYANNSN